MRKLRNILTVFALAIVAVIAMPNEANAATGDIDSINLQFTVPAVGGLADDARVELSDIEWTQEGGKVDGAINNVQCQVSAIENLISEDGTLLPSGAVIGKDFICVSVDLEADSEKGQFPYDDDYNYAGNLKINGQPANTVADIMVAEADDEGMSIVLLFDLRYELAVEDLRFDFTALPGMKVADCSVTSNYDKQNDYYGFFRIGEDGLKVMGEDEVFEEGKTYYLIMEAIDIKGYNLIANNLEPIPSGLDVASDFAMDVAGVVKISINDGQGLAFYLAPHYPLAGVYYEFVCKAPAETPEAAPEEVSPKTGDNSALSLVLACGIICLAGGALVIRKKYN